MSPGTTYDVLIIGAGITGVATHRLLKLHGLNSLLIDKGLVGHQTSSRSSKMLHGGIRYLENFDFSLVNEALTEKNYWLKKAPQYCYEQKFLLPIFKESKRPLFMIRIGLFLYDALSKFKNTPHSIYNSKQTLAAMPLLREEGLRGAGVYHDAVVNDLAMTKAIAEQEKESLLEFAEFKNIEKIEEKLFSVTINHNGEEKKIQAKKIIFSLGPMTDQVLNKQTLFDWQNILLPSKGSHLWINKKSLPIEQALLLQTKDERVLFAIPWEKSILVGTTEILPEEELYDPLVSEDERQYMLKILNHYFPHSKLSKKDIVGEFAGIRPLLASPGQIDKGKISRKHIIFTPTQGVYVMGGGKFTTFRIMAKDMLKMILRDSSLSFDNKTMDRIL